MKKQIIPVDFETEAIEPYPDYPPKPVGVAVRWEGKYQYLAWGHPCENNCTKTQAKKILRGIWRNHIPLFHNASFDLEVAYKHFGLPFPAEYHDTLFLAFLNDPRETNLSLKPLADKYLDMPATEQDKLNQWIEKHVFEDNGLKPTKANPLGAHIAKAPGKLVGKYAVGDIKRTLLLYKHFYPSIVERGMGEAYLRELAVMPIFNKMSRNGIHIACNKLYRDTKKYTKMRKSVHDRITKKLGDINIDSGPQLADAMDKKNLVKYWIETEKGNRSTSKENLMKVCKDKKLVDDLSLHSTLNTYLDTFMNPWLEVSNRTGGTIHPSYNQVRSPDERSQGMRGGTRTGRPSSMRPNFLNVPSNPYNDEMPWTKELPLLRDYIVPATGNVLLNRDYSQQEVRILGHYEEGDLYKGYNNDPKMDVHDYVQQLIWPGAGEERRKPTKILNFGMIYGMGASGVALKLGCTIEEAKALIAAHRKALPAVKQLNDKIKKATRKKEPIVTWGGREYYAEPAKIINGKRREFDYKQINYLIQGGAADCTKEAMIRVDGVCKGDIILQVYDEIMLETESQWKNIDMKLMREAMESVEFDVPMLTDGKWSGQSWARCKPYKDK